MSKHTKENFYSIQFFTHNIIFVIICKKKKNAFL